MSKFTTEQERFWAGSFGDEYADRNKDPALLSSNVALFARILKSCAPVSSAIELGANLGLNLRALRTLLPAARLKAVEINAKAVEALRKLDGLEVEHASLLQFAAEPEFDLAFTKGVLIHIAPEDLPRAYRALYGASRRYVLAAEYYNPSPVELDYRGHRMRLFKRDFAGEMLDAFPDLRLVDYGFVYRRGSFPLDDITWFLLEKTRG